MKALLIDADVAIANVFAAVVRPDDPDVTVNRQNGVQPEELPALLAGYRVAIVLCTNLPIEAMARCTGLRHVIFLGTGAHSYMDPEALAAIGIKVHTIRGYGDRAVAEHTIGLMMAAARGTAFMDRRIRAGMWQSVSGTQLSGKTLGLIGFGGIAAEVARIGRSFMRVLAWNRTPRHQVQGVEFLELEEVLAASDVISLHLLLTEQTRGLIGPEQIAAMRRGVILVNTARAGLVDESALLEALYSGHVAHAALDVFNEEPLSVAHPFIRMNNVTLSAHSASFTPEADAALVRQALEILKTLR